MEDQNFKSKFKMSLMATVVMACLTVTAQAATVHPLQTDTAKMGKMKTDKMGKTDTRGKM